MMKYKITYKQKRAAGLIELAFLAILILFTSCNTRKSIQAFLDLPATQSLNVSKTTLNDGSFCSGLSEILTVINHDKENYPSPDFATFSHEDFSPILNSSGNNKALILSGRIPEEPTPLYLLYRKMKVLI